MPLTPHQVELVFVEEFAQLHGYIPLTDEGEIGRLTRRATTGIYVPVDGVAPPFILGRKQEHGRAWIFRYGVEIPASDFADTDLDTLRSRFRAFFDHVRGDIAGADRLLVTYHPNRVGEDERDNEFYCWGYILVEWPES